MGVVGDNREALDPLGLRHHGRGHLRDGVRRPVGVRQRSQAHRGRGVRLRRAHLRADRRVEPRGVPLRGGLRRQRLRQGRQRLLRDELRERAGFRPRSGSGRRHRGGHGRGVGRAGRRDFRADKREPHPGAQHLEDNRAPVRAGREAEQRKHDLRHSVRAGIPNQWNHIYAMGDY